jgi:hypothetical protein
VSHKDHNASYLQSVKRGDFSNAWVDRILQDAQCQVVRGSGAPAAAPSIATHVATSLDLSIELPEPSAAIPVLQPAPAKPAL